MVKVGERCPHYGPLSPVGPAHAPRSREPPRNQGRVGVAKNLWVNILGPTARVQMLLASWEDPETEKGSSSSLRGPRVSHAKQGYEMWGI